MEIPPASGDVLAALDRKNNVAQGVCFGHGGGAMPLTNGGQLEFHTPAAAIVKSLPGGKLQLTLADPQQSQRELKFQLTGRYAGPGCSDDATDESTFLTLKPGTDMDAGRSVTIELNEVR